MDLVTTIILQPGYGGLVVLTMLTICFVFYGSLIVWIARGGRNEEPS